MRQFTGRNPDELSEEEFIAAYRDYSVIKRRELKDLETVITNSLLTFWNKINGKK